MVKPFFKNKEYSANLTKARTYAVYDFNTPVLFYYIFDLLSTIIIAFKLCVIFKHKQQTKHYLKHHPQ